MSLIPVCGIILRRETSNEKNKIRAVQIKSEEPFGKQPPAQFAREPEISSRWTTSRHVLTHCLPHVSRCNSQEFLISALVDTPFPLSFESAHLWCPAGLRAVLFAQHSPADN